MDAVEIHKINYRPRNEQLQAKQLQNLEETDTFLETHNLPRLSQEEIKNINRSITSKDLELVIQQQQ